MRECLQADGGCVLVAAKRVRSVLLIVDSSSVGDSTVASAGKTPMYTAKCMKRSRHVLKFHR